jgi:hypothetical protein
MPIQTEPSPFLGPSAALKSTAIIASKRRVVTFGNPDENKSVMGPISVPCYDKKALLLISLTFRSFNAIRLAGYGAWPYGLGLDKDK